MLVNFENPALSAKIFLAIIHRYTENVFGICTHCNLCSCQFFARQYLLPVWFAKVSPICYTNNVRMYLYYMYQYLAKRKQIAFIMYIKDHASSISFI